MNTLDLYKIAHLVGVMATLMGLVGLSVTFAMNAKPPAAFRAFFSALHGVGLLTVLVAGFAMAGHQGFLSGAVPHWLYGKIAIWLVFGASVTLAKRKAGWTVRWVLLWLALGLVAASLGVLQPG